MKERSIIKKTVDAFVNDFNKVAEEIRKISALEIDVKKDGTTDFDKTKILNKIKMALSVFVSINAEEINNETIQTCKSLVNDLKNPLKKMEFDMNIPHGYANNEQVQLLAHLNNHIQETTKENNPLRTRLFGEKASVTDGSGRWSFKQVLNSNVRMNGIIDKINNHTVDGQPLSPYEKYLAAYSWVSSFSYKSEDENDDKLQLNEKDKITSKVYHEFIQSPDSRLSRDPLKILQEEKRDPLNPSKNDCIVCVGYATLLERICQGIGINCTEQLCEPVKENEKPKGINTHSNNAVHLQDSKYGIDGIYHADSTLDSRPKNGNISGYCWHAVSYNKLKIKKRGSIERLDFQNARDNKKFCDIRPYRQDDVRYKSKMERFINSFDTDTLQRLGNTKSIPLEMTQKALYRALTCELGQVNSLGNVNEALYISAAMDWDIFTTGTKPNEKEETEIKRKIAENTLKMTIDKTIH